MRLGQCAKAAAVVEGAGEAVHLPDVADGAENTKCLRLWGGAILPGCHPVPHKNVQTPGSTTPQRSLREIPSFFIMAFNVVRGTPSRVAVVLTTPPVSRKTRRM